MMRRRLIYALWLAAVASLYFFENNSGTRAILIASVILPLSSILSAWLSARRTVFSLSAPDECRAGETVFCRVEVSHALPFADAEGTLSVAHLLTGETFALSFSANTTLTLLPLHSGAVALTLQDAGISDVFGLFRFPVRADISKIGIVLPKIFDAHVVLGENPSPLSEGAFTPVAPDFSSGSDTTSFREYLPGDSVRQIHWKLSSKLDRTMLRETSEPPSFGILLTLRTAFPEPPAPNAMDETLSNLFSVSRALLLQGIPHFFSIESGEAIPISSESDWAQAMLLAFTPSDFAKTTDALSFSHIGVFSPRPDTDAISLFHENRVTLILPESVGVYASPGAIRVAALGENQPMLEL